MSSQHRFNRLSEELAAAWSRGTITHAPRHLRDTLTQPIRTLYGVPRLAQLIDVHDGVTSMATVLLEDLTPGEPSIAQLQSEFAELEAELALRLRANRGTTYPADFRVAHESALFLYGAARRQQPDHVVETGVAEGVSSFFLLGALGRNRRGTLHSADVGSDAGGLVLANERDRWDLRILSPLRPRRGFRDLVRELPAVDFFFHDSDHTMRWQTFEYTTVIDKIRRGGLFTSDDVDSSWAFVRFCARRSLHPSFLLDHRKVFAAARI